MSGSISGLSDLSLTSRLVSESGHVKQQLDTVTEQAASGKLATTYSGLGAGATVALNLEPQIAEVNAWQTNINGATATMSATQNVMTELTSIATQFSGDVTNLSTSGGASIDVIAAQARQALQQVAGLLNAQVGNNYIFSGQDASNPAVPDASNILSSSYFTQIQSTVANLGANGATATTAAALAAATAPANSVFDPTIGTVAATVEVGHGQRIPTGILANQNASASGAASTTSTGSYMQDLMYALASIGSLSSSQASLATSFTAFIGSIGTTLQGALTGLNTDSSMLGSRQTELGTRNTDLGDMVTTLTTQVSDVEDVDMASTATRLSALQTQLQASYKLIGDISQFSLVSFMPA